MSYVVGIDLGTTSTVAAVCRPGGTAQVVPLEGAAGAVPSAVYLGADGTFLVGEAAGRRELSDPGHVVRDLTRRVGDPTPLLVGRQPVSPDELVARFLVRVVDDVAKRESGVAARVAVTHPAGWGPHRLGALHAALAAQGLGSATLIPEPVAAATGYAASARVEPGATVGVYDLGGGRCDATVLRRGPDGFTVVGSPDGVEQFGGTDLDEVVLAHIREALGPAWEKLDPTDPEVLAAAADLRRAATAAKEALSHDTEVLIPVVLPGVRTQVRLGRAEFEEMIRPALVETAESVRRALDGAGVSAADLAALVLVGGSSRIPLVPQLLSEEFGRDVTVAPDPVGVVAMGAALLAGGTGGARKRAPEPAAVGAPARIPPAKVGPGRCRARRRRRIPGRHDGRCRDRLGTRARPGARRRRSCGWHRGIAAGIAAGGAAGPLGRAFRAGDPAFRAGNPAARGRRGGRPARRHRRARRGPAAEAGAPVPGGAPAHVASAPDRGRRGRRRARPGGPRRGGGVRYRADRRGDGGRCGDAGGRRHLGTAVLGGGDPGEDAGAQAPAAPRHAGATGPRRRRARRRRPPRRPRPHPR